MKFVHEIIKTNFSINQYKYEEPQILHWHRKMEICRMIQGTCEFEICDKKFLANEGDFIVINPGEIHRFNAKYGRCVVEVCTFNPMLLYNLRVDVGIIRPHISLEEMVKFGVDKQIGQSLSNIYEENTKNTKCSEILVQANILQIYGLLLRFFESGEEGIKKEKTKMLSFQKALEYISENYSENLTLTDLAKKLNYSPGYVSTMFLACTGVNFKYYLDNIRINKALDLLKTSEMTIAEIAILCGYENIRTFNNTFKRIIGLAPTEVKTKLLKKIP